jgi:VWFA-related protein
MRDVRFCCIDAVRLRAVLFSIVIASCWPTLPAAEPVDSDVPLTPEQRMQLEFTEREDVRLVQVPVVVTDRRGRPVRGLESADFRLIEDGVPQRIQFFNTEAELPISLAFLLDVSGSMRQVGKLDGAKEAIRVFVDALAPHDRFGLIAFAGDQVAWITDFTDDRDLFLRRLEVQEAFGQTALFDAIAATPHLVDESTGGSRAIVMFTDGVDTASRLSRFEALQLARSVNVPIYAIGFATFASRIVEGEGSTPDTLGILRLIAEETGGRLFVVYDPDDLKEATLQVQQELRFRYVLTYLPSRADWDGSFRRIDVETSQARLRVHARNGYYARP